MGLRMMHLYTWRRTAFRGVSLGILAGCLILLSSATVAAQTDIRHDQDNLDSLETYSAEELKNVLAALSDEQVRGLLMAELEKQVQSEAAQNRSQPPTGMARILQGLEALFSNGPQRIETLAAGFATLPDEVSRVFSEMAAEKGGGAFLLQLAGMIAIIAAALALETVVAKPLFRLRERLSTVPVMSGLAKFNGAALALIPPLFGILIFAMVSIIAFLLILGPSAGIRPLFVLCLTVIVLGRLLSLLSRSFCAPGYRSLRLLPLDDSQAQTLHRKMLGIIWILVIAYLGGSWLQRSGVPFESIAFVFISVGTLVILIIAHMIWENRTGIAQSFKSPGDPDTSASGWLRGQFAALWHVFALDLLFIMWLAWAGRLILYGPQMGHAFFRCLAFIPLYLLLDRLAGWIIPAMMGAPEPASHHADQDLLKDEKPSTHKEMNRDTPLDQDDEAQRSLQIVRTQLPLIRRLFRIIIFLGLLVWLLKGWNIEVPFIAKIADAGFDIVVTIVLALFIWRGLNRLIARKLAETATDPSQADQEEDDEWGAANMDRSHTLLPMLRKAIGMVMLVMVIMIILSELGVNIGPLLAGAGVIGLAVGFGAQKLVADILSGFFFLMDDAFRVGEYIQAGSVSGTVEAITLRNAMLRHHRGMLQIVPFSDLGSITNFMRGGMVVKFNIELPYDTDIEKVRKTIKKVGKKMLQDPELGPNFIAPIKSQGVRSVGDSVMTFRVKFTAKPGKHFVIRREAFRRITEALEANGIYYAHRRVIVELPANDPDPPGDDSPSLGGDRPNPPQAATGREQLLAGAAAGLETILNEETQSSPADKKRK